MFFEAKRISIILAITLCCCLLFACAEGPLYTAQNTSPSAHSPQAITDSTTTFAEVTTALPVCTTAMPGQATAPTVTTPDINELLKEDASYIIEIRGWENKLIRVYRQYIYVIDTNDYQSIFYDAETNTVYSLDENQQWIASNPEPAITKASVLATFGLSEDSGMFAMFKPGNYYLNYEGTQVYLNLPKNYGLEYCMYTYEDGSYHFEYRRDDHVNEVTIRLVADEISPPIADIN